MAGPVVSGAGGGNRVNLADVVGSSAVVDGVHDSIGTAVPDGATSGGRSLLDGASFALPLGASGDGEATGALAVWGQGNRI